MVAYFDTSLLFNVYLPQASGAQNVPSLMRAAGPPLLTEFGFAELRNALRLARFRNDISDPELEKTLERIARHVAVGVYAWRIPDWPSVFERAEQIGAQVSARTGLRSMDLIHLAIAIECGAADFFSADHRQCAAAALLGLEVHRH